MFGEYFTDANWVQTMPGIYSCILHQENLEKYGTTPLSLQLSSGVSEVIFCTQGKIVLERNSGQIDQLENESILLISDCGQLREVKVLEPLEGIFLCVHRSTAKSSLTQLCRVYGDLPITMKQVGQMMEKWKGVCLIPPQEWSQSTFHSLLRLKPENRARYCVMKCFELLYLLYLGAVETSVYPAIWKTDRLVQMAEAMQNFIINHLDEKLTIDDLSRHFHLSATACKTCFHACCEQPIHQWISNKRMEKAAELLKHSTMPIIDVAQSVGYSGCSQFNATFKKKYGKTPSEYRKFVCSH